MKRLFFLITLTFFSVGALTQAFAAPARNAVGGGLSTKRIAKPKANKRATRQIAPQQRTAQKAKTKAQERAEARAKQFGLMPSELDSTNHSVFHADAAAIKGARDTESALRYLPFVTIINTAGFGQQFDLRAQGRLSANGVKLYINGITANSVDSYFNPMPIATIIPSLIDEVSVTPGGGAVLYGSGAKGGKINIITSKRNAPYFVVGGGYVNTMASKGNSFNAFAHASERLSRELNANAGLAFQQMGGPREDDSSTSAELIAGADYVLGLGQKLKFDADIFYGKTKTTPYGALVNEDAINEIMLRYRTAREQGNEYNAQTAWEADRYACLSGTPNNIRGSACEFNLYSFEPTKENRKDKGNGEIETTNLRATGVLGWESEPTKMLKFNADLFYALSSQKYDTYKMNLPYFVLGYVDIRPTVDGKLNTNFGTRGYNWFLPRPHSGGIANNVLAVGPSWNQASQTAGVGDLSDGQRADWHFFDQSGSTFKESKVGLNLKMDFKHNSGELVFGASSVYEMSNKKSNSHLRQAIVDGDLFGGGRQAAAGTGGNKVNSSNFRTLVADIFDKTDISVLTNSIFFLERYDFSRELSVALGARYEMKNYNLKVKDEFVGQKLKFGNIGNCANANDNCFVNLNEYEPAPITDKDGKAWADNTAKREFSDDFKKNYDNFTFELAPVYRYSNSGAIYARGELGYIAPPAWAMLQRVGIVSGAITAVDIYKDNQHNNYFGGNTPATLDFDFGWLPTNLKSETYYTAELGFKETIGTRAVPLGFTDLTINALLFSASVFYTDSKDEFYFTGDTWSGMELGTYEKSRRMGVEVAMEQYLFGGALGFNESFTYLKAEKFDCTDKTAGVCKGEKEWSAIPYTYDYKATLGAIINASTFIEITDMSVYVWLQNSIYGNQNIYSTQMQVLGSGNPQNNTDKNYRYLNFKVTETDSIKLKPYIISDFGVSVGFNKNMGVVTVGVKNVFDTFYYDYYNNDRSAVVNENRYVIGRGRTVFLEGTFKY